MYYSSGPRPTLSSVDVSNDTVLFSTSACFYFGQLLSMKPYVNAVCKSSFFHDLRNIVIFLRKYILLLTLLRLSFNPLLFLTLITVSHYQTSFETSLIHLNFNLKYYSHVDRKLTKQKHSFKRKNILQIWRKLWRLLASPAWQHVGLRNTIVNLGFFMKSAHFSLQWK